MGKKSINYYSPEDPIAALGGKAYLPEYVKGEGECELEISNCQVLTAACASCGTQNSPFKDRPKQQWHWEREMTVAVTTWFFFTCRAMVGALAGKDFPFGGFLSLTPLLSASFVPTASALSQPTPRLQWGRGSLCSASVLFSHFVTRGMSSGATGNQTGETTIPVFALPLPGLLKLHFLTQQPSS